MLVLDILWGQNWLVLWLVVAWSFFWATYASPYIVVWYREHKERHMGRLQFCNSLCGLMLLEVQSLSKYIFCISHSTGLHLPPALPTQLFFFAPWNIPQAFLLQQEPYKSLNFILETTLKYWRKSFLSLFFFFFFFLTFSTMCACLECIGKAWEIIHQLNIGIFHYKTCRLSWY